MPKRLAGAAVVAILGVTTAAAAQRPDPADGAGRITILYDAFGPPSALQKDWGFAALVEYGGRRILFDTGNDADVFAHNARQLDVDLARLDAVVLSHRHGDHTTGLQKVLDADPRVPVHVPQEGAFFKSRIPEVFLEREPGLPAQLRYYEGQAPQRWLSGTPWPQARFHIVTRRTEIFPGFTLISTRSATPSRREPPRRGRARGGSSPRPAEDRAGGPGPLHQRARLRRLPGPLQGEVRPRRARDADRPAMTAH